VDDGGGTLSRYATALSCDFCLSSGWISCSLAYASAHVKYTLILNDLHMIFVYLPEVKTNLECSDVHIDTREILSYKKGKENSLIYYVYLIINFIGCYHAYC
jgi:hypothetical protein